MKNVSEVEKYMDRLVSKLELELELAIVFTEVRHICKLAVWRSFDVYFLQKFW